MRNFFILGAAAVVMTACGGFTTIGKGRDHDGGPDGSGISTGGKGAGGASAGGASAGGASAGGASAGGTTGDGCKSTADCAVPQVCKACPDGSYECATGLCVSGKCEITYPACSGGSGGTGGAGGCTGTIHCPLLKQCPPGQEPVAPPGECCPTACTPPGTGGASGGNCKSATDCAVPAICKVCSDGSASCAQGACVNGQCSTTFPPCPVVDGGGQCNPAFCPAVPNAKPCCVSSSGPCGADQGSGCVANGPQCKADIDCPQLGIACQQCSDGSAACPFSKCQNGQCISGIETCPTPDGLKWFATCGPPVCRSPDVPTGAPLCDPAKGQKVGGSCSPAGATCDPGGSCSGNLLCALKDPKTGTACPVSRAKYKQDIEYLSADERQSLANDLQAIPLVRYRYKDGPAREHLGFIIEDVEPSPSVDSQHDQVDLYGYTSMTVAALQQQHAEIEALKRQIRSLEAALVRRAAGESTPAQKPHRASR